VGPALVAIGPTAAWVHGALALPPDVTHVQRGVPRRVRRPVTRLVRFRDTAMDPRDTVVLAGVRVSTPARTLVDLAREAHGAQDLAAAARLAVPPTDEQALAWIAAHPRVPGTRAAAELLRSLAKAPTRT